MTNYKQTTTFGHIELLSAANKLSIVTVLYKILRDVHSIDDKIEYFLTLYTGFSSQPIEQPGGSIVKLPTTVKN